MTSFLLLEDSLMCYVAFSIDCMTQYMYDRHDNGKLIFM